MILRTGFTKKEHVDAGLALLLLTLLFGLWLHPEAAVRIAIAELIVILIAPVIIYPFTFLWLNISELLGRIMSRVILTVIFLVFVCPVALMRRAMGKDTLLLKRFKSDNRSVLTDRNHCYTKKEFTTQF